ncbi:hypothetical protein IMG5_136090 [Ichthyophthirius multifiliis]|uniref:Uncharacterized protein n=1 Tax=Ichthyophthirius multifiliis TaxID=5932 RepID=G0QWX3_ICHMU|nr:hypothetical protein IMG5_136090 [Ichthyophthirius multifiliis]EGR30279.1 hypothetical protein IMG5_136090 [Ichthyophthirius multifiliis]|eukprot:XP_004031866.1 hypothetical protein IMG5_136090 [Ichthyophthirius multifiliis]
MTTGLSWMLYREGHIQKEVLFGQNIEKLEQDRKLNTLFEEIELPDGQKIYHNQFNGYISDIFQQEKQVRGGILADQMGLGKTLMSISLIQYDLEKNRRKKGQLGTLIVLTVTTLGQWRNEIDKFSVQGSVKVLSFYEKRDSMEGNIVDYDIVLTTYGVLGIEFKKKDKSIIFKNNWRRVILDEAQKIKSKESQVSEACYFLKSEFKWALTGTPLENKIDDLYSLFKFLEVNAFSEWRFWKKYVSLGNSSGQFGMNTDVLHALLKPIILRRQKDCKYQDGKDIISLPKKNIYLTKIQLDKGEKRLYQMIHDKSQNIFNQLNQEKLIEKNYIHVFQIINKLRQLCVHPSLAFPNLNDLDFKEGNEQQIEDQLEIFFGKFQKLKEDNNNKNNKNVQISESYKNQLINQIKNKEFQQCLVCFEDIIIHSISKCGHVLCKNCFQYSILQNKNCPMCRTSLTLEELTEIIIEDDDFVQPKEYLDFDKVSGSKLKKILELIDEIHNKKEQVIIFSQYVRMLSVLEYQLCKKGISCRKLDGKTSAKNKSEIVKLFTKEFQNKLLFQKPTALLASLKVASVGLNLVGANNVILCDPWWNPAIEDQAVERVHRIGQNKEVFVWRIICEDTIEERIHQLHEVKRKMINNALTFNKNQNQNNAIQDLIYIMQ